MTLSPTAPLDTSASRVDVLVATDFAVRSDIGLRLRREIECLNRLGCSVGLLHMPSSNEARGILPDIAWCVRRGLAQYLSMGDDIRARLVLVHQPGLYAAVPAGFRNVKAERVVLVHHSRPDAGQVGQWFGFMVGPVSWAPTNRWIRRSLEGLNAAVPIEPEDWRPIAVPNDTAAASPGLSSIGRLGRGGASQWSGDKDGFLAQFAGAPELSILGFVPDEQKEHLDSRTGVRLLSYSDTTVDRFLKQLDVFSHFPSAQSATLPDAAIVEAMALGRIVLLPERLRPHFGPGAIYLEPDGVEARLDALRRNADDLSEAVATSKAAAAIHFSEAAHAERCLAHLGPVKRPRKRKAAASKEKPQMLFVPSNGVGTGHVMRLLAIARHLDHAVEPVFVSMSKALPVIQSFGYHAEYIPSPSAADVPISEWDGWARLELGRHLDRFDAAAMVYDGNAPTPGIVSAAASLGDVPLVWVRRGMYGKSTSTYLQQWRSFDLVIEPGEIAASRDIGATVAYQDHAHITGPIRLLSKGELLSRAEARDALGLPQDSPVALVQLGAGLMQRNRSVLERTVGLLGGIEGLKIVCADLSGSAAEIAGGANLMRLTGAPIALYLKAFDFTVASAGYNTFHEVIGSGVPAIFVPNTAPGMDDQNARADFAQDSGAGFNLPIDELSLLPVIAKSLLNPAVQAHIRMSCANIDQDDGAPEAARAILDVLGL